LSLKAIFNKGLSSKLKAAFPDVLPAIRPQIPLLQIQDPN
jgi:hypothetical protein